MKPFYTSLLLTVMLAFQQQTAHSQDSTQKSRTCEYRTDGKSGAHGLRLSLWIPCTWIKQDIANASIIGNYSLQLPDSNTLTHVMSIDKLERPIPAEQLKGLFSSDGMKMIARQAGKYVSGSKVQVRGWDAAEVRYWNQYKQNSGMVYSYGVQYYIPMDDKIINISYVVAASDKDLAKSLFAKHETEFRTSAQSLLIR